MRKSFYTLEFFVQPGGSRMSWLLITDKINMMEKVLAQYFLQDDLHKSLYLLLCYGTNFIVQTYQHGKKTQRIGLSAFIKVEFEGYLPATISELTQTDEEGYTVFVLNEKETKKQVTFEYEDFENILFESTAHEQWKWNVTIDWESAGIETLKTPLIDPFDKVMTEENYLEESSERFMGLHNTEYGGFSQQLNWENLFDLPFEDQEYYEMELSTHPEFCEKFLKEASAAIDLTPFGFEWVTKDFSAEYSSDEEVQLARMEIGDETIFLNYHLNQKEYQINCSFVFTIQADLTETFFRSFTEKYILPGKEKLQLYGDYNRWKIEEEWAKFRETVKNNIPAKPTPGLKKICLPLGNGYWPRMAELENKIIESKAVMVKPVCLASENSTGEEKTTQFYTLFSASLVSIIAKPGKEKYEFYIEAHYLPDHENQRYRGLSYFNERVKKEDLPLDLYDCLWDIMES